MTTAPVVLFVYNRPETTAQVFDRIAAARPRHLLVVADGPSATKPEDATRCQAVREIVSHPRWNCDLQLNVAEANLGPHKRFSSGLAWAFGLHEELIILEDDCLPEPTFFPFCGELLQRFRNDQHVMMIAGCNFQFGRHRGPASYYFSQAVGTWGWATWRRAFRHFDPEMTAWPHERQTDLLSRIWPVEEVAEYWRHRLDEAYRGEVDAWDYQWALAMWRHSGVQIASNTNLIRNIGCDAAATHTRDPSAPFCNLPTSSITFPLTHPEERERDLSADVFEFYRIMLNLSDGEAALRSSALVGGVT